jgi:hypothetical protein
MKQLANDISISIIKKEDNMKSIFMDLTDSELLNNPASTKSVSNHLLYSLILNIDKLKAKQTAKQFKK